MIILGFYSTVLILATGYAGHVIFSEQRFKEIIGWNLDPDEVHYTKKTFAATILWSMITGFVATVTGLGGGTLLNPFFSWLKYQPVTASWTINLNTLLSKIAAVILIIISGHMMTGYVLLYGILISIAIFIAENTLLVYIKKRKSQVIIPIGFLCIVLLSLGFTSYITYSNFTKKQSKGGSLWDLGKYC